MTRCDISKPDPLRYAGEGRQATENRVRIEAKITCFVLLTAVLSCCTVKV